MKKFLYRLLVGINILVGGLLIASYTSKFIPPNWCLPIAFSGMIYAYILIPFIFLSILLLSLGKKKWFIFNLLLIVLGWNSLLGLVQVNLDSEKEYDFRVMTYNVKLFDLYNWNENKIQKRKMMQQISLYKPDIVCFQEFYYDKLNFPIDSVCLALEMPYYYAADNYNDRYDQHFGQAIFSKYPIKNKELIQYPSTSNMSLYCDIEIKPEQIIRVYSNHIESYRLSPEKYQMLKNINEDKSITFEDIKVSYQLFKQSLIKRAYQAEKVSANIHASKYPVIVAGDFNDTPNSFVYHKIKGDLKDAFREAGFGFSNTFTKSFLGFRIDYILYQSPLKAVNYQSPKLKISDHYPVIVDFVFDTKN